MLTLEEVIKRLEDKNLTIVAKKCGLTRAFLSGIRSGKVKNPSYYTMIKLSNYLSGE